MEHTVGWKRVLVVAFIGFMVVVVGSAAVSYTMKYGAHIPGSVKFRKSVAEIIGNFFRLCNLLYTSRNNIKLAHLREEIGQILPDGMRQKG